MERALTVFSDAIGWTAMRRAAARGLLALMLAMTAAACATPPDDPDERAAYEEVNDPLEPMNRTIFEFNMFVDEFLLRPVAKAYEFIFPDLVRNSVRNFLRNLKTPVILANDLMQGEVERAGDTAGRFIFNTLIGAGLFDPASEAGVAYHEEDFGQTLAVWGVDGGPYLMLPFLGPSNLRDTGGFVADRFLQPTTYWAENSSRDWAEYSGLILGVTEAVDMRSRNYRQLEDLQETSLDFYATVRSLYRQQREALIENRQDADQPAPMPSMSFDSFLEEDGAVAASE
ncbi:MAG: VacJ family lipoprotein [Marivibrio sp.]|uniref:MlaA family lipoprotein n=1 Tax=Marivibrio sp. TaxID=2039719 RepID=UPI0032EEFB3E